MGLDLDSHIMASYNMAMKNRPRSSSLGVVVLGMLIKEPMHAYRMQKLMKSWGKDKVVNVRRRASIYQTLQRLLGLGLIEIWQTVKTESHPDRIVYGITDQGRHTVKAWIREMLTTVGADFPDFPAAVSMLVLLTPADAKKHFEIRADAVRNELQKLEAEKRVAGDLPRLFLLEDAYRTALLNAEFAWLQAAIADFSNGSLNWNEKWLRDIAAKFTPNDQE
jgi:DNA-binding PadR family transcriptional regulator